MQGRGRRWPKKKPSGSESEEEEHVGQGVSSVGSRGVSRGLCSGPLGASALSPARQSCSGLDPCNPLWASRLELAAATRRAAPEIAVACSEARSPPSTLSSLASPAAGRVRHARLRLEIRAGRSPEPGPASRPASRPCAPPQPPLVLPGAPRPSPLRPPEGGRVPSPGASPAASSTATRGGFGRPLERSGQGRAVRAAGPEARVWGMRLGDGGRGRCWRDGTE